MLIYICGGWTLLVTISSKNPHCVLFVEENSDIMARKFADEGEHEMMYFEGKAVNWIIGESFNK